MDKKSSIERNELINSAIVHAGTFYMDDTYLF